MKQYCRYCAEMCCGDANYCHVKDECLSDSYIKRVNNCKHFVFNEIDAINYGTYRPRVPKSKDEGLCVGQLRMEVRQ